MNRIRDYFDKSNWEEASICAVIFVGFVLYWYLKG